MGNTHHNFIKSQNDIVKENIFKYDMTLHKLVHNDSNILYSEKHMEHDVDNDIRLINNITNSDKNLLHIINKNILTS